MGTYNAKEKIIEHYDLVSPFYHSLWGEHLHHGYWVTGKETKEEAQVALTEYLAKSAEIKPGSKILDVGCGFGASSIYLAKKYKAKTIGVTISSVQVKMAEEAAKKEKVDSKFLLMDAENMSFGNNNFDVVWSIESISHYKNKEKFFKKSVELLKSNGIIAIIDWHKKENLSDREYTKNILPIEKGMLVELNTLNDYCEILKSYGMEILKYEDISKKTSKTWDISLEIIKNNVFWKMALKNGRDFVNFLKAFIAMKKGFSTGSFVYGMIIARKK